MRFSLRAVLLILVALVAAGSIVSALPAQNFANNNWHEGACKDEVGVTLVVDFASADSSKSPVIKCAKNFKGTGWDIFAATATSVSGTTEYPTGFVCRLLDLPTERQQPCTSTPTYQQGSWAYYFATADTGPNWMFSGTGSQMRSPACGSVEGWRFIAANESASAAKPQVAANPHRCD